MIRFRRWMVSLLLVFQLAMNATAQAVKKRTTVLASWYGRAHAGKTMANGQVFDPGKLTAASPTLPFGTRLKVTCLRTGRSVWIRITDRGPFKKNRKLDLSEAAAKAIGLRGVEKVAIEKE